MKLLGFLPLKPNRPAPSLTRLWYYAIRLSWGESLEPFRDTLGGKGLLHCYDRLQLLKPYNLNWTWILLSLVFFAYRASLAYWLHGIIAISEHKFWGMHSLVISESQKFTVRVLRFKERLIQYAYLWSPVLSPANSSYTRIILAWLCMTVALDRSMLFEPQHEFLEHYVRQFFLKEFLLYAHLILFSHI